ncbi:hypothetical protein ACHAXT_008856 [Thalassiosira profunda]
MPAVNAQSSRYCYIDIDIDNHRSNLALTAAFVDATDSRYGFCSKDLRKLGGSELSRLHELMSSDHAASSSDCIGTSLRALACANFASLCTNGGNSLDITGSSKKPKPAPIGESGKELTYRNSAIHRVVKGFIVQGGDIIFGNGAGGESVYNGKKFKDERAGLALKHDRAGILLIDGQQWQELEYVSVLCDSGQGSAVRWKARDVWGMPFRDGGDPSNRGVCGRWWRALRAYYHHRLRRLHSIAHAGRRLLVRQARRGIVTGITPEFMIRPRVGILAPTGQVGERFKKALGEHASTLLIATDAEGRDEEIVRLVMEPLERFALDVVVAAPVCAKLLGAMDVPASWNEAAKKLGKAAPNKEEVFIEAKPVEVLSQIVNESWLGKKEGWLLSASFVQG